MGRNALWEAERTTDGFRGRLGSMVKIYRDKQRGMAEQRCTPPNMIGIFRKSLAPWFLKGRGFI